MHLNVLGWNSSYLLALNTVVLLFLSAIYMANLQYKKLFESFVILIFLRFFLIFVEAFGGLMQTGIGLIVSGAVILALVYLGIKKDQSFVNGPKGY